MRACANRSRKRRNLFRGVLLETLEKRSVYAGDLAFVASSDALDSLLKMDADGVVLGSVKLPGVYPTDVVFVSKDQVIGADQTGGITSVDLVNKTSRSVMQGYFLAVAFDPASNKVFGVDTRSGEVKVAVNTAGAASEVLAKLDGTATCAQFSSGSLLVSVVKDGVSRLQKLDLTTRSLSTIHSSPGSIETFTIRESDKTIFFGDQGRSIVASVGLDGSGYRQILDGVATPKAIALGNDNKTLVFSSLGSDNIQSLDLQTGARKVLLPRAGMVEGLASLFTGSTSSSNVSGTEATSERYGSVTYDFGPAGSPVEPGAIAIDQNSMYSTAAKFGWVAPVQMVDTGRTNDLDRDFVSGTKASFRADVPNGTYIVEPRFGDRLAMRDRVRVTLNGSVRDEVTTTLNEIKTPRYVVKVTDGSIIAAFEDLGGTSNQLAVTGLTIRGADSELDTADVPAKPMESNPVLVVLTHGFSFTLGDPSERSDVASWMYRASRTIARQARRTGGPAFDGDLQPISYPRLAKAQTDEEFLNTWTGSRQVVAINYSVESRAGTPGDPTQLISGSNTYNEREHREVMLKMAEFQFRLISARINEIRAQNPNAKLDIMFVGHSFGTNVNRETLKLLNNSDLAQYVDYVQHTSLDPVAMNPDRQIEERADTHDRYVWENFVLSRGGQPLVDRVFNMYQTRGLTVGSNIEADLKWGEPLDGEEGGTALGMLNGLVFSINSRGETAVRFGDVDPTQRKVGGEVLTTGYSPDGKLFAMGTEDGVVNVYDATTNQLKKRIEVSDNKLLSLAFTPDSRYLVTVSKSGIVRQLEIGTGNVVWRGLHRGESITVAAPEDSNGLRNLYRGAKHLAMSPDGQMLVTAGNGDAIKIWTRDRSGVGFERLQSLPSHTGSTNDVAFAPDGTLISAGDKSVVLWRQSNGRFTKSTQLVFDSEVNEIELSTDGNLLAVATAKKVSLYRRDKFGNFLLANQFTDHVEQVTALAFSSDGSRLATGSLDRTIFVYSTNNGSKLLTIDQPMLAIRELRFDPSGQNIIASFFDQKGGPVIDVPVYVSLTSGIKGSGHNQIREDYIDQYLATGKEKFFVLRDAPNALRFGDFTPPDSSNVEYLSAVEQAMVEFDPYDKPDPDEELDRQAFAQLQQRLLDVVNQQAVHRRAMNDFTTALDADASQLAKLEADVADQVQNEKAAVKSANAARDILSQVTALRAATLSERDRIASLRTEALRVESAARQTADQATTALAQSRAAANAALNDVTAARQRFNDAKPAQKAARRAELDAAQIRLAAAELDVQQKDIVSKNATAALNRAVDARKLLDDQLQKSQLLLAARENDVVIATENDRRAQAKLLTVKSAGADLVARRDRLEVVLNDRKAQWSRIAAGLAQTKQELDAINRGLSDLRQRAWLVNFGLDGWDKASLQPVNSIRADQDLRLSSLLSTLNSLVQRNAKLMR